MGGGTYRKVSWKIRLANQVVKLNDTHENFRLDVYAVRVDKDAKNKRNVQIFRLFSIRTLSLAWGGVVVKALRY